MIGNLQLHKDQQKLLLNTTYIVENKHLIIGGIREDGEFIQVKLDLNPFDGKVVTILEDVYNTLQTLADLCSIEGTKEMTIYNKESN